MIFKQLVGLPFIILICHAAIIQAPKKKNSLTSSNLLENQYGQFPAEGFQSMGLSDLSFTNGPWGTYGDKNSNITLQGGHALVRDQINSLNTSPQIIEFDNSNFFLGAYPSIKRSCHYNNQTQKFKFKGPWVGNLSSLSKQARSIINTLQSVVRIQYQNNFWRGYNIRNQAVIVFQRITKPFTACASWLRPIYARDYKNNPAYNPYQRY